MNRIQILRKRNYWNIYNGLVLGSVGVSVKKKSNMFVCTILGFSENYAFLGDFRDREIYIYI